MEWFVVVFIFFGTIALTGVLFGAWLLFTILKLIIRGFVALVSPTPQARLAAMRDTARIHPTRVAAPTLDAARPAYLAAPAATYAPPVIAAPASVPGAMISCGNRRCRGTNPASARFCRRCGTTMEQPQRVAARKAAML